jgi:bis(5'-adenosyl)-triphosphatase
MSKSQKILDTCPFCQPGIEGKAFATSNSFLALYNIAPILTGHSIIIPQMHIKSLRSLSNELVCELFLFARKVTDMLLAYYDAEAFDWSLQDGEAAGQTVSHLHLHIVVRFSSDLTEPGDWYPLLDSQSNINSFQRSKLTNEEYLEVTSKLQAFFNNADKRSPLKSDKE